MIELLSNCKTIDDLTDINQKNWFLNDFSNDVTVKGMIGTINKLTENFKDDNIEYYQFIKKQIRFWHFKTNETSQGEELYITMNSRGQQLSDNETVRAKLFENEKLKTRQIEWGAKWERWQDFFWKNRKPGGNADSGLNQFLRWANVIECFSTQTFISIREKERKYKNLILENQVLDYVSLVEIEPYFDALEQLKKYDNQGAFSADFYKQNFSIEWLQGDISQLNLMKLFPALMFLKSNKSAEELNRFIRFFSNITNDIIIAKNPDTYIINIIELTKKFLDKNFTDVVDLAKFKEDFPYILSNEEMFKLSQYKKSSDSVDRKKLEQAFWAVEDYKFSKGKIGHLIQMAVYSDDSSSFAFTGSYDYQKTDDIKLEDFVNVFSSYSELITEEYKIWGNLIDTEVYSSQKDRLSASGSWHINPGFLKMVLSRRKRNAESLLDFLYSDQKKFILKYNTEKALFEETHPQKQLYIYYILHTQVLKHWNWHKWNVGIYDGDDYPRVNVLFAHNLVYQFYASQWRYNVGYEWGTGVWLQDNFDHNRNYLQELINWATN